MTDKVRQYAGKKINVGFDASRCIHAAECVKGLPEVFDPDRRPWIDADAAGPDDIAEVVSRCPTGALQFERLDGGAVEAVPDTNTVLIEKDGPLYCRGKFEIRDADGDLLAEEKRVALCRCGASKIKPYCDGSHSEANFLDEGAINDSRPSEELDDQSGTLSISCRNNGPLIFKGAVAIESYGNKTQTIRKVGAFCRCGLSANKPFCDGTHKQAGFKTDS